MRSDSFPTVSGKKGQRCIKGKKTSDEVREKNRCENIASIPPGGLPFSKGGPKSKTVVGPLPSSLAQVLLSHLSSEIWQRKEEEVEGQDVASAADLKPPLPPLFWTRNGGWPSSFFFLSGKPCDFSGRGKSAGRKTSPGRRKIIPRKESAGERKRKKYTQPKTITVEEVERRRKERGRRGEGGSLR